MTMQWQNLKVGDGNPKVRRSLDLGAGAVVRAPGAIRADHSKAVKPDAVLNATQPLPSRSRSLESELESV
ncbi:MAG: hypothetical protein ACE5HT_12970 [Gemmatimonadales bacterium]